MYPEKEKKELQYLLDEIQRLSKLLRKKDDKIAEMQSVIDDIPGSIYWKDKTGRYLGINKASSESMKSLGYPSRWEDIVGKTDYDLFSQSIADEFRRNDQAVMLESKTYQKEEEALLPSIIERINEKIEKSSIKKYDYSVDFYF